MVLVQPGRALPRTRRAKRIMWSGGAALASSMVALSVLGSMSGGSSSASPGFGGEQGPAKPLVMAAVSDPTRAKRPVLDPGTGVSGADGRSPEEQQADAAVRSEVIRVAQSAAGPLSTYSFQETPQTWVNRVPSLTVAAQRALLSSGLGSWPQLQASRVTVRGQVPAGGVQVVETSAIKRTAKVSVSVRQEITREGGTSVQVRPYVLQLRQGTAAGDPWLISSIA